MEKGRRRNIGLVSAIWLQKPNRASTKTKDKRILKAFWVLLLCCRFDCKDLLFRSVASAFRRVLRLRLLKVNWRLQKAHANPMPLCKLIIDQSMTLSRAAAELWKIYGILIKCLQMVEWWVGVSECRAASLIGLSGSVANFQVFDDLNLSKVCLVRFTLSPISYLI